MHSGIVSPQGVWWKPAAKPERRWVLISLVWCLILFAMMPLWHWKGGQNPSGIRGRVDPAVFSERVERFNKQYQVGEDNGIPVVQPPPGSHAYLMGSQFQWSSVLKLEKGAKYILHLSSQDVNHGFSLYPVNLNFQVVPGYDYGLEIVPNQAGEYRIVCNEFCGIGHHTMIGKVIVVEPGQGHEPQPKGGAK
ncbi:MAG: cytochrome C oxidase subunit II [Deltaproteobacteria bacterium]|nr:cytochrome C oxidase subunit II [Deltaproteobacteria bacterium]